MPATSMILQKSLKEYSSETIDNVRRLRHHASMGLWCGNNELESAWDHWGISETHSPALKADYIKQFEYILPNLTKKEDQSTFYWPSSPSSGVALIIQMIIIEAIVTIGMFGMYEAVLRLQKTLFPLLLRVWFPVLPREKND